MAADFYFMLGVGLLQTIAEMYTEINPALRIRGLLPTRVARTTNAREVVDHTRTELGDQVHIFACPVPETVKLREAAGLGKTIFEHAPETPQAAAYWAPVKSRFVLDIGVAMRRLGTSPISQYTWPSRCRRARR